MANIGTTTAFYKVETSLTRANTEVSKSMERLATGKQNANAGDRSSYVAMADTFRMDFVGTKAGIKGGTVVMGYLETGMRVLDAASGLLSRLQELAVLGANNTNTVADHDAINSEAEAIADEFNRLMSKSKYKGKDIFVSAANSEYVSMGGRDAEMTFGIGTISYTELYGSDRNITYAGGPSNGATKINLTHLPSDAVFSEPVDIKTLEAGVTYEIVDADGGSAQLDTAAKTALKLQAAFTTDGDIADGVIFKADADDSDKLGTNGKNFKGRILFSDAGISFGSIHEGARYKISDVDTLTDDERTLIVNNSDLTAISQVVDGVTFTASGSLGNEATSGLNGKKFTGQILTATSHLTTDIEAVQAKINTARVQAGSQYAAIESAINYTTDLTAQYELGFNTVNDVNFSMETAHLAKNQILQQAATAMLAQANQGQQGLLQLIQG
jgi:flagellin